MSRAAAGVDWIHQIKCLVCEMFCFDSSPHESHAGTRTCDGLRVPAVWRRLVRVKLAHFAFAHILLFVGATPLGVGVRVGVRGRGQGGGRGCQLGSPLTVREMKGPLASGAAAPPAGLEGLEGAGPWSSERKVEFNEDASDPMPTPINAPLRPCRVFNFKHRCCCCCCCCIYLPGLNESPPD